jgi:hypothetical protein
MIGDTVVWMVQLSIMHVDADDRRYSCECG